MSWQAYVDQQMMDKKLKKAAIAGFDGNIWAKVGSLYSPHSGFWRISLHVTDDAIAQLYLYVM